MPSALWSMPLREIAKHPKREGGCAAEYLGEL